ncbi:MAG: dTDP-4-dehydrorhamnose reductase [Anaerolineae bacterium]|nr:dTDP-4-dehydrorhamnose reductase [Anaerolineae bacterium]
MRIFITGWKGQLGQALQQALCDECVAGCDLPEVDITDRTAITRAIAEFAPDAVIHAAAWTDVDGCARNPGRAFRVNVMGTRNVGHACSRINAAVVYISTNEVFDGSASEPYRESDPPQAINPYGQTKADGEWFLRRLLAEHYIVRTAWLYAPNGRNFPHRIVELADERGALRVVSDEVSNPTYAPDLAAALAALIHTGAYGVYHLVNEGYCSRYDFARAILRLSGREHVPVEPIALADFERASTPPPFAPLANTAAAALGIVLRPWEEALEEFVRQKTQPDE